MHNNLIAVQEVCNSFAALGSSTPKLNMNQRLLLAFTSNFISDARSSRCDAIPRWILTDSIRSTSYKFLCVRGKISGSVLQGSDFQPTWKRNGPREPKVQISKRYGRSVTYEACGKSGHFGLGLRV